MSISASNGIKRGQAISFRIPSDTPDHVLKQFQRLKDTEKRNFSSKVAEIVMQGITQSLKKDRETISIPLPQPLSKVQRDWLKHEHSEALLGSIIYQLISDPIRSTSLLAALNSNTTDINQALYLQEERISNFDSENHSNNGFGPNNQISNDSNSETAATYHEVMDDLNDFDWSRATDHQENTQEKQGKSKEEDLDDLLGGFLAQMNK